LIFRWKQGGNEDDEVLIDEEDDFFIDIEVGSTSEQYTSNILTHGEDQSRLNFRDEIMSAFPHYENDEDSSTSVDLFENERLSDDGTCF